MNANDGMWVVAETLQGGGTIDAVYGPYWSAFEAEEEAERRRLKFPWRRDLFQVYLLTGDFS